MPMLSGWLAGTPPRPSSVIAIGALMCSANRADFLRCPALQDALAREDDRLLRRTNQRGRLGHLPSVSRPPSAAMAADPHRRLVPGPIDRRLLGVLGDVHEHGPGRPALGEMKRLFHRGHDVLHPRHQIAVLGDRERDALDVGLLERVVANELARDLAGDADHRRRVHHGRGDAGDHVRGARAGRGDGHPHAAASAGVAVGHVRGALLVAHQHVPDRIVEHGVVGRQDRPAGIAENGGHTFVDQTLPDDLRARACIWHGSSVHRRVVSVQLIVIQTR